MEDNSSLAGHGGERGVEKNISLDGHGRERGVEDNSSLAGHGGERGVERVVSCVLCKYYRALLLKCFPSKPSKY